MSAAERGIRFAAATLPATVRERYREQWLADVRDAEEMGVSRAAIVAGALSFSLRLGRSAEMRGYTVSELMLRRLRWGMALVLCAPVVLVTLWVTGAASATVENLAVAMVLQLLLTTPVIMLGIGLGLLVAAARTANRHAMVGVALAAIGLFVLSIPSVPHLVVVDGGWLGSVAMLVAFVMLATGAVFALVGFTRGLVDVQVSVHADRLRTTSARRARAGIFAFLGFAVLLAFGICETLVIGPLAQAPDYTLAEIYAMLSPADRGSGVVMALIWLVLWGMVSIAFLVLCLVRGRFAIALNVLLTPRRILVYALTLGSVIIFFHWWSGFSLGMSIADTVPPMVGRSSWQAIVFSFIGSCMLIAALLFALVPGRHKPAVPAASATPTLFAA